MIAAKVRIRKNRFVAVWLGRDLGCIRQEVSKSGRLYEPDTLKEIPLEVAQQINSYSTVAHILELATGRFGPGAFLLGRIPEKRGN